MVNELIRKNSPREVNRSATMDEAKAMGAIALFGEKYGDRVRVVKFGDSIELCGGCHAAATGQIGLFKIVSETAIAAGVRRIEAVTGSSAENYIRAMEKTLTTAKALFNNVPDLSAAIRKMIEENADFKKEIDNVTKEKTEELAKKLMGQAKDINGIKVITFDMSFDPAMVRGAASQLQKKITGCVLAGAFSFNEKPNLVLMYSDDLVAAGHDASKDIREAARFIQGGGGGQPSLATAGGKNVAGLKEAMAKMIETATK